MNNAHIYTPGMNATAQSTFWKDILVECSTRAAAASLSCAGHLNGVIKERLYKLLTEEDVKKGAWQSRQRVGDPLCSAVAA